MLMCAQLKKKKLSAEVTLVDLASTSSQIRVVRDALCESISIESSHSFEHYAFGVFSAQRYNTVPS